MKMENTNEYKSGKPDIAAMMAMMTAPPKETVSERTVEDFSEMDNAVPVQIHKIPSTGQRIIHRVGSGGIEHPFLVKELRYQTVVFKSREAENIGNPEIGKNIEVFGYDIAPNAQGQPMFEKIRNPFFGQEGHEDEPEWVQGDPIIIDTDATTGEEIEPFSGMTFKPYKGRDTSRQIHAQLGQDKDALTLIPGRGVPRVQKESKTSGNKYWAVDWTKMHSFQQELEKPMLNARLLNDEPMLEFLFGMGGLPTAANAPSLQAQGPGKLNLPSAPPAGAAVTTEDDTFEAGPQAPPEE